MLDNYFTQAEVSEFRVWMEWADNYVVTAHVSPDGDALGSSLALALYLKSKGKNVSVVLPDDPPEYMMWMPGADEIITESRSGEVAANYIDKCDVLCCLDYNGIGRSGKLATSILYTRAKKIMIDHHPNPFPFCDYMLSRPEASSTSELIFHLICALGGWGDVTRQIAECICTGMITDTGGFEYNSNTSQFFYIISKLIDKNVDKDYLFRRIFNNCTEERLRFKGFVLNERMSVLKDCHISLIVLSQADQNRFNSRKGDTEGFVNMPLQIDGMLMSVFLREDASRGIIKISVRTVGSVPANRFVSEFFNGGGHLNAAGGEFSGTLEECESVFRKGLEEWRKSTDPDITPLFIKK